jgi:hypothetical protein
MQDICRLELKIVRATTLIAITDGQQVEHIFNDNVSLQIPSSQLRGTDALPSSYTYLDGGAGVCP